MPQPTSLTTQQLWHHWEIEQVLTHLQSQREGLSYVVARQRLRRYGRNQLPKQSRISQIALQPLANPFTYGLIAIVAAVQYWGSEGWSLLLVGVFHAGVGMYLTFWGNQIGDATRPNLPSNGGTKDETPASFLVSPEASAEAIVRRDGEEMDIPSRDFSCWGDIVAIASGDRPQVDMRLLEAE
ncbi:MAG: hypothetical protein HC770_12205, partial [Pseudanabaena sp. CRU_2_10]|nr:hypothetical protein [Pseudanabaena sp. CRU_2_10]